MLNSIDYLFLRRGGKDDLVFGSGLLVDGVDGVDDVDNILDGDRFVRTEDDAGIVHPRFNARGDEGLETVDVGGGVAHLEVVILVDVYGDILLGHGLAAALGEKELDGVGADKRGCHHEEDQQQEHQVGHGGAVVLDGEFVSCLYHGCIVSVIPVLLGFVQD